MSRYFQSYKMSTSTKICTACGIEKNLEEFRIRKFPSGITKPHSWCRICDYAYHAKWKRDKRAQLKKDMEIPSTSNDQKVTLTTNPPQQSSQTDTNNVQPLKKVVKKLVQSQSDEQVIKTQDKPKISYRQQYYIDNKERILQKNKEYKVANKEKVSQKCSEYYQKHKETIRDDRRAYLREYYLKNKEKIHKYMQEYRNNNPEVKLRDSLRSRLFDYIYKNKHTEEYLGTQISIVKLWIEYNFEKDMSWSNHGSVWQLDHTIPLALFECKEEIDQWLCFNWKNLYPMMTNENKCKHAILKMDLINNRKQRLLDFCTKNNMVDEYNEYINLYDQYLDKLQKQSKNATQPNCGDTLTDLATTTM